MRTRAARTANGTRYARRSPRPPWRAGRSARVSCAVRRTCRTRSHAARIRPPRPMADVRIVRTFFFRRKNVPLTPVLSIL
ncbi:hypothetical protein CF641_37950 [Burkholderia pseudomallei]|nr:hypothetical protein CF641_37950 [Burkholderia pseudomallei]